MKKLITMSTLALFAMAIVGCSDVSDKQPKVVGTPDPKIQGPAAVGGAGAGAVDLKPK